MPRTGRSLWAAIDSGSSRRWRNGVNERRQDFRPVALTDLFRAKWTDEFHNEWTRNVLENRPDLTREQLEHGTFSVILPETMDRAGMP